MLQQGTLRVSGRGGVEKCLGGCAWCGVNDPNGRPGEVEPSSGRDATTQEVEGGE